MARPDVEAVPDKICFSRRQKSLRHIGHIDEIASLGAIAYHRERLACELLAEKDPEDGAIGSRRPHTGAIGIEYADRVDWQRVNLAPVERRLLALIFGQGIGILRTDRMIFPGGRLGQSITGRGSCIDKLLDAGVTGAFKHANGALDVDVHVIDRPLDRGYDVTYPGEMKDVFRPLEDRIVRLQRTDVFPCTRQISIALVMDEVAAVSARQIVDDAHRKATHQQKINHMATDKAGASGDNRNGLHPQAALSRVRRRTLK